jgi:RNA polymerase sigma-70 factor (ECF subfamily)
MNACTTAANTRPLTGTSPADAILIARIARREEAALGELYDRYSRLIYAIALRIANDHNIAEEVTQDVFHAIWQSAASFHAQGSLNGWIMGIARHRAIDATRSRRFRARQREQALYEDTCTTSNEEPHDLLLLATMVRDALTNLPNTQRQPITMAFYGGLTHTEIAAQLGEPVGTIKSRMRLGLLKLRDILRSINES